MPLAQRSFSGKPVRSKAPQMSRVKVVFVVLGDVFSTTETECGPASLLRLNDFPSTRSCSQFMPREEARVGRRRRIVVSDDWGSGCRSILIYGSPEAEVMGMVADRW